MGTMQSTLKRVETDEALANADAPPDGGWQPAGPPLNPLADVQATMEQARQKVIDVTGIANLPGEPVSRETTELPGVGEWVVYHMRDGDSRARRTYFPALVMAHDETPGTLKLWLVIDDGDSWMQDRVPMRAGSEPGWVRQAPRRDPLLEHLTAKLGEFIDTIAELTDRIDVLEAAKAPPPKASKRK